MRKKKAKVVISEINVAHGRAVDQKVCTQDCGWKSQQMGTNSHRNTVRRACNKFLKNEQMGRSASEWQP